MKIEIDQSIKVENTSTVTVIADTLGHSVSLSANSKRALQQLYRSKGTSHRYIIEVFSALVAYLIALDFQTDSIYIIDEEYVGNMGLVKQVVIRCLQKFQIVINEDKVRYGRIGKHSTAHKNALRILRTKEKATKRVLLLDILKLLEP